MLSAFLECYFGARLKGKNPRAVHLAVCQDDFRDAADHGDEVEDIPGVSEIVLPSEFRHGAIRERRKRRQERK